MVHRLHNRNVGYSGNATNTLAVNQATINATEGATALNIDTATNQNTTTEEELKKNEIKETTNEPSLENISMENATYLQNMEEIPSEKGMTAFEVDSIELATPKLFPDDEDNNSFNQENNNEKELGIFENLNSKKETEIKEPKMFEESDLEEDFEIPAFLRRQKN